MTLNSADALFADRLAQRLPPDTLRAPEPRYLAEPRDRVQGQAGILALPRSAQDVSAILDEASRARVPVVPYGGGTGLVGGQVMPDGPLPLVLSLERMAAIRAVYPEENVLVAEAGAILADVQAAAREAGRLYPLSLASEGSCRIGGTLGSNAGGVNVLRYGTARELCLGLEAVLPDGRIWNGLDPAEVLEELFGEALEQGLASDGLIAQSQAQAMDFWNLREHIPEANRRIGSVSSHDISLPLGAVPDFIAAAPQALARLGAFRINCFGHLGDGNLHYNVFPAQGVARGVHDGVRDEVRRLVYDLVHRMGGSISAEHGIGRDKVDDLERYGDPVKLAAMRSIKAALDPQGILNPGAVLATG